MRCNYIGCEFCTSVFGFSYFLAIQAVTEQELIVELSWLNSKSGVWAHAESRSSLHLSTHLWNSSRQEVDNLVTRILGFSRGQENHMKILFNCICITFQNLHQQSYWGFFNAKEWELNWDFIPQNFLKELSIRKIRVSSFLWAKIKEAWWSPCWEKLYSVTSQNLFGFMMLYSIF